MFASYKRVWVHHEGWRVYWRHWFRGRRRACIAIVITRRELRYGQVVQRGLLSCRNVLCDGASVTKSDRRQGGTANSTYNVRSGVHHGSNECDEESVYRMFSRLYHGAIRDWSGIHVVVVSLIGRARIQVACVVNQYPHSDCDELDIHAVIIGAQRGLRVSLRSKCSLESDNGRSRTVAESWVWERMVGYSSMVRRSLVVAVGVFHCHRTFEVHLLPVAVTKLN